MAWATVAVVAAAACLVLLRTRRFVAEDPDDGIRIVLVAPSIGTLEPVGADALVGQSFAVRVSSRQNFNRVLHNEDFVLGKFLPDIPLGPATVTLSPRFVAPCSTLATDAVVHVEVREGVQPVQLVFEPRARLRVICRDGAVPPVDMRHVRVGAEDEAEADRLVYFNSDGQRAEVRALPVPGVQTLFGPQLEPGGAQDPVRRSALQACREGRRSGGGGDGIRGRVLPVKLAAEA
jgi:hypothetical protein